MKRAILLLVLISFSITSFTQDVPVVKNKEYYLKRSKSQKGFAFILLGVSAVTFAIVAPGNVDFDAIAPLALLGVASGIGSITLFLASGRNKRKAATVQLQMQRIPYVKSNFSMHPGISVKLQL